MQNHMRAQRRIALYESDQQQIQILIRVTGGKQQSRMAVSCCIVSVTTDSLIRVTGGKQQSSVTASCCIVSHYRLLDSRNRIEAAVT